MREGTVERIEGSWRNHLHLVKASLLPVSVPVMTPVPGSPRHWPLSPRRPYPAQGRTRLPETTIEEESLELQRPDRGVTRSNNLHAS